MPKPKFSDMLFVIETNDNEKVLICFNNVEEIPDDYFNNDKCTIATYTLQKVQVAKRFVEFV